MRLVPCLIVVASLCVGSTGCALFNKRGGGKDRAAAPAGVGSGEPGRTTEQPTQTGDPLLARGQPPAAAGMLAGRVLDGYTGRPVEARIHYECLDDPAKDGKAPIDADTNAEGFFAIPGLKPGKQYKLIARSKGSGKVLAGTVYSTVPNPRLVIKVDERLATPDTPPPKSPGASPEKTPEKAPEKENPSSADKKGGQGERPASAQVPSWQPGVGSIAVPAPPPDRGFGIGPPQPLQPGNNPPPSPTPQGRVPTERIAVQPDPAKPRDAEIAVPNPSGQQGWQRQFPEQPRPPQLPPAAPPAPPMNGSPPMSSGAATTAPFVNVLGKKLDNMALPELNSGLWEWRTHRRGKLVLLDFWHTSCSPCLETIPQLRILQSKYGPYGLEVVGIACEAGGTPQEQADRVARVCNRLQTNYRLLMAGTAYRHVHSHFNIRSYPTLILMDETGGEVWRQEGAPQRRDLDLLELKLRTGLGGP